MKEKRHNIWRIRKKSLILQQERKIIMATAIRAIPTLYGESAFRFEREAEKIERHPGTEDYRKEAKVVSEYLKKTNVL